MGKNHFIPAALIARFSDEDAPDTRKKRVWTLRSNGHRSAATSGSIGFANRLYDFDESLFPSHGADTVDKLWDQYETELPAALDRMIGGTITAEQWIATIVPFVAAAFVRDRGYKTRMDARLADGVLRDSDLDKELLRELVMSDASVTYNRVNDMERYAARALASYWSVYELDGDLVLPDLGYGFNVLSQAPDVVEMMLPIGKRHLLGLTPQPSRYVLYRQDDAWIPNISHARSVVPVSEINRVLAYTAQDFIVGTKAAVDDVDAADIGLFDWATLDRWLAAWPFNIDTRQLNGLHGVVQGVLANGVDALRGAFLNRHQAFANLDPRMTLLAARGESIRADRLLEVDKTGLRLTVHELLST